MRQVLPALMSAIEHGVSDHAYDKRSLGYLINYMRKIDYIYMTQEQMNQQLGAKIPICAIGSKCYYTETFFELTPHEQLWYFAESYYAYHFYLRDRHQHSLAWYASISPYFLDLSSNADYQPMHFLSCISINPKTNHKMYTSCKQSTYSTAKMLDLYRRQLCQENDKLIGNVEYIVSLDELHLLDIKVFTWDTDTESSYTIQPNHTKLLKRVIYNSKTNRFMCHAACRTFLKEIQLITTLL